MCIGYSCNVKRSDIRNYKISNFQINCLTPHFIALYLLSSYYHKNYHYIIQHTRFSKDPNNLSGGQKFMCRWSSCTAYSMELQEYIVSCSLLSEPCAYQKSIMLRGMPFEIAWRVKDYSPYFCYQSLRRVIFAAQSFTWEITQNYLPSKISPFVYLRRSLGNSQEILSTS